VFCTWITCKTLCEIIENIMAYNLHSLLVWFIILSIVLWVKVHVRRPHWRPTLALLSNQGSNPGSLTLLCSLLHCAGGLTQVALMDINVCLKSWVRSSFCHSTRLLCLMLLLISECFFKTSLFEDLFTLKAKFERHLWVNPSANSCSCDFCGL
jgi:hypothetical protein